MPKKEEKAPPLFFGDLQKKQTPPLWPPATESAYFQRPGINACSAVLLIAEFGGLRLQLTISPMTG